VAHTYLGVVDRLGGRAGRPARLRPLFQASTDKSRWIPIEEEFPNCGLVSWWQPFHEASSGTAWYFHIEASPTFSHDKVHHDYYRVKGAPSVALELVDVLKATDLEELRAYLLNEGMPLHSCISRKIVFRDGSGSLVGPLELKILDNRFFADEKHLEAPLTVYRPDNDLGLVNLEGHKFLPLEGWQKKIGEVDFSIDTTFLKRVIRDLKDIDPALIEKARLTDKLIGSYCSAAERTTLTNLQKQRLKRLHKISGELSSSISLTEDAVSDLLSLSTVRGEVAKAGEEAAQGALKKARSMLDELEDTRKAKAQQVVVLEKQLQELRSAIDSAENQLKETLGSFDYRLQEKFEDITHDASSFLANIAVLRAALSPSIPKAQTIDPSCAVIDSLNTTILGPTDIIPSTCRVLEEVGASSKLGTALLASWSAGFTPIMYGERSREAIEAISRSLSGGRIFWGTLGPTLASPLDLMKLPIASAVSASTIEDIVSVARESKGLVLLVLDHVNLCQLDNTFLPLVRSYATVREYERGKPVSYVNSYGSFPSNILLAGIIIDSPLALPMSREIWTYATFVDAKMSPSIKTNASHAEVRSAVPRDVWANWICSIEESGASDAMLLATHMARTLDLTTLSRRMVRQLASAIDKIDLVSSDQLKAKFLAEILLIPNLLARGLDPNLLLRNMPVDMSEDNCVSRITNVFEKWGISSVED
jgi:hypothetical protein